MARTDDILHPFFAGRIAIKDCDGYDLGEWDVEVDEKFQGHRIFRDQQCWQVDGTREARPIVLGTGGGMQAVFHFERHPGGREFGIKSSDGRYLFRDTWWSWVWTRRGYDQLRADRREPKEWGRFSIAVKRGERETSLAKVAPCYAPFLQDHDEWLADAMAQVRGNQGRCTVAVVGIPQSGKSRFLNVFGGVIAHRQVTLVPAGGRPQAKGHLTLRQRRIDVLSQLCSQFGFTSPVGFEVRVCDLVGMREARELECALQGKTRSGELWPRDRKGNNGQALSEAEVEDAIAEIEGRATTPANACHFILLAVTANTLLNLSRESEKEAAGFINDIFTVVRRYTANVTPSSLQERVPSLPARLVIMKTDEWAKGLGCNDPRSLLGGPAGFLKPLYAAAKQTLGFSPCDVTPIGWMEDPLIDYRDGRDPRVVVVKHLMTLAVQEGCQYAGQLPVGTAPPSAVPAAVAVAPLPVAVVPPSTSGVVPSPVPKP